MKKRISALFIALILTMSMLSGCDDTGNTDSEKVTTTIENNEQTSVSNQNISEITQQESKISETTAKAESKVSSNSSKKVKVQIMQKTQKVLRQQKYPPITEMLMWN